jgi:oligosaccharyltransferase complex subunit beta
MSASNHLSLSCLLLLTLLALLPFLTLSIPLQTIEELTPLNPRTLILSTSPTIRQTHSLLFSSLTSRDHTLTFAHPYDDHLRLIKHSQPLYDNLILFTDQMEDFGETITLDSLIQWVDDGHNLVLVWGGNVSEPVRLLGYELGVVIGEDEEYVVDHFHVEQGRDRVEGRGDHSFITTTNLIDAEVMTGIKDGDVTPIVWHGLPHTLSLSSSSTSHSLYIPILKAEPTAITTTDSPPLLISAYQTRSNTRVLFCGSSLFLSNSFLSSTLTSSTPSSNSRLVSSLIAWTFRERGVLRATHLLHHQVNGVDLNPHSYRVSDYTSFSIQIEQFTEQHQWLPYLADDIPLSFTMIDPYIRHALTPHPNATYTTSFQIPDVYGVYKFVIDYVHTGYSSLTVSHQVSVTPYRHDQYERFLWVASPYYVSAFTLMGAFLVFGWVFLYGKDEEVKRVTETVTEVKRST